MAPAPADEANLGRRHTDRQAGEKTDRRREARRQEDREPGEGRATSLHVNTEKVDELVNLVGELVITHTMLKQLTSNFEMDRVLQLESAVTQLERNTRDLQQRVMAIRMQPVSFVFGRFGRLVRDVSHQLGKQVELRITGEQSELDKTVIEKLTDPLTHLVRNALDHGVEPPQERRLNGKPETAVLALHAEHKSGNIMIEVRDDGRGIDLQKVHDKAVQQGLIGAHEELDETQLQKLLFLPGFSTAQTISDLSGRGVGLDVVRRNIDELGGTLEVSSQRGLGTAFIIRLPLTLAILDGMSVSVGDQVYIVPMIFIIECLQPEAGAIKTVAGRGCVVEVRGSYVPMVELHKLFGIASTLKAEQGILLLIEADGNKVALLVDALLGQDQVVVKSLDANYRKVQYITGATILGDGRVALILDVAAVVRVAT
jgi:two-component system chemotaxis sensor kinase CheA